MSGLQYLVLFDKGEDFQAAVSRQSIVRRRYSPLGLGTPDTVPRYECRASIDAVLAIVTFCTYCSSKSEYGSGSLTGTPKMLQIGTV